MKKRKNWTSKERRVLKKYYKAISMEELLKMLPNRTEQAIYNQVNYLRNRGWTFG